MFDYIPFILKEDWSGGRETLDTCLIGLLQQRRCYLYNPLQHLLSVHFRYSTFGDQQDNSLQDYIESALMLQYNNH